MIGLHPLPPAPLWHVANIEAILLASIFLTFLVMYLAHESHKLRLRWRHWLFFDLPDSMHFAIAIAIFDVGFLLRGISFWVIWPRMQIMVFVLGAAIAMLGALCKIRAITKPVFGDAPWMWSAVVASVVLIGTIYFA